jgi:hypothetical protein
VSCLNPICAAAFPVLFQRTQGAGHASANLLSSCLLVAKYMACAVHDGGQDLILPTVRGTLQQLLQAGAAMEIQAAASGYQFCRFSVGLAELASTSMPPIADDIAGGKAAVDQHHAVGRQLAHIVPV